MTQMDINFCILLFYIVLRNVMAFDKEIAILYRFFNLKISKKAALVENVPMGPKTFFLYIYIYIKMYVILNKTTKFSVLNQSGSVLLVPAKYILEKQKIWSFFSVFDDVITKSRDLGRSFLVCQKLIIIFQVWTKFHFIWLSISDFNQGRGGGVVFSPPRSPLMHLTSIKNAMKNRVNAEKKMKKIANHIFCVILPLNTNQIQISKKIALHSIFRRNYNGYYTKAYLDSTCKTFYLLTWQI